MMPRQNRVTPYGAPPECRLGRLDVVPRPTQDRLIFMVTKTFRSYRR